MKALITLLALGLTTGCFGQAKMTPQEIDNLLKNISLASTYRYWYGNGEGSMEDFKMDTVNGKLLKYTYKEEGKDTFHVDYFFFDNYLVKVLSGQLTNGEVKQIGVYYFANNKMSHKYGRNIDLKGKKLFDRIAPRFFASQLEHIYYQYEYLNPNKQRFKENVPALLMTQRDKIDKRNSL